MDKRPSRDFIQEEIVRCNTTLATYAHNTSSFVYNRTKKKVDYLRALLPLIHRNAFVSEEQEKILRFDLAILIDDGYRSDTTITTIIARAQRTRDRLLLASNLNAWHPQ